MKGKGGFRKHFIRRKEDFLCERCVAYVVGDGYTNHCPKCLYSKHVDAEMPGDRASQCQGLMKPVAVEYLSGEYMIIHKCIRCGKITRNKAAEADDFEAILEVARQQGSL
jgi:hypothetical protein